MDSNITYISEPKKPIVRNPTSAQKNLMKKGLHCGVCVNLSNFMSVRRPVEPSLAYQPVLAGQVPGGYCVGLLESIGQ
jgi:hypothetical protein